MLYAVHHIAIICSNYNLSKKFYVEDLGFTVSAEYYRAERDSWKLDLTLQGQYMIELFSFPNPPKRVSGPEACGLRHLAFKVKDIEQMMLDLKNKNILTEPLRVDEFTGRRFTFFSDPDGLPLELYEQTND